MKREYLLFADFKKKSVREFFQFLGPARKQKTFFFSQYKGMPPIFIVTFVLPRQREVSQYQAKLYYQVLVRFKFVIVQGALLAPPTLFFISLKKSNYFPRSTPRLYKYCTWGQPKRKPRLYPHKPIPTLFGFKKGLFFGTTVVLPSNLLPCS